MIIITISTPATTRPAISPAVKNSNIRTFNNFTTQILSRVIFCEILKRFQRIVTALKLRSLNYDPNRDPYDDNEKLCLY